MDKTELVGLAVEVLLLLLLVYVAFFKSYFQEKGKNVATKEDVEELTSLVETVKSNQQFSLQAKLSLRAEEHQALVDYFSRYTAWQSAVSSCSFVDIGKDNTFRFAEIRAELNGLHVDFELAAGKMELFVENEDIQRQHGPLVIEMLKFQGHAIQATYTFAKFDLEVQQMELHTPQDQQLAAYQVILDKRLEFYTQFKKEQLELYSVVLPMAVAQRLSISKHIRAISNN